MTEIKKRIDGKRSFSVKKVSSQPDGDVVKEQLCEVSCSNQAEANLANSCPNSQPRR